MGGERKQGKKKKSLRKTVRIGWLPPMEGQGEGPEKILKGGSGTLRQEEISHTYEAEGNGKKKIQTRGGTLRERGWGGV